MCVCVCLLAFELDSYLVLIEGQQQQDAPAQQQADVLQQELQPRPLAVDVDHGGQLERDSEGEREERWGRG